MKLVEAGDTDRALVEFRNTLKYAETDIEARRQMALIFLERGNKRAAYRNYLGVVEQKPEDLEGRTALSTIAFEARNWDEFERHSKVAIELAPDDPTVKSIQAATLYRAAVIDEDSAMRDTILAQAETLTEDQPDNEILRQILIDGYVAQEKYDSALNEVEKAIAANPKKLELYNAKLELLARLNRGPEIEKQLRTMAELFPDEDSIKATYLRFLLSRGEGARAEDFLRTTAAAATDPERQATDYASLVQFILRTRGPEAALSELEIILAEHPDQDPIRALRASIRFDAGERSEGITELQDMLGAETPNLTKTQRQNVQIALARMLATDGNEVGARKLVEEILSEDPNAVNALKIQANWLIREDKTDEAINALRTALDQAPEDVGAMTLMAEAYERAGNKTLMLEFLSLATEASGNAPEQALRYATTLNADDKPLQAESILINALRINPGNVPLLTGLGRIYLQIEDMPRAQQVVDTLRSLNDETATSNANTLEVEVLSRTVGTDDVLGFLEELAGQTGAAGDQAKLALLRTRLRSGDNSAALALAQDLVAEAPDNLQFRNALALTHASLRNYDAAEVEFKSLLEQEPRLVPAWVQLARVYVAQGKHDTATSTIDEALKEVPDSADLLWAKASYLQRDGDIDGAINIYEDLYTRFSNSLVIANNLASLLSTYRTEDSAALDRAQVIAKRLKNTDVPAFQDTYGWLQHLSGDSETALTYLVKAAESLPQDLQVQVHLGMIYAALGRNQEATTQLQKAVAAAGPLGNKTLVARAQAKIAELEQGDQN